MTRRITVGTGSGARPAGLGAIPGALFFVIGAIDK